MNIYEKVCVEGSNPEAEHRQTQRHGYGKNQKGPQRKILREELEKQALGSLSEAAESWQGGEG